ncbi:hypothetical protein WH43_07920 [Rheinheimera sp. KL1]|uniref:hypothetical protein n=1 Tax=Rheinheimera sp. KL1 TaxID=1635005 RepID=UPI0006A970B9|nr:hypothetical protein [Rheinheimera sp. KL1]KOO58750.1 hypothetical protein WH43_07920 [Rheinheimera sp. KL1]
MNILGGVPPRNQIEKLSHYLTQGTDLKTTESKAKDTPSSVVTLSDKALKASASGASAKDIRIPDGFGSTSHRIPPQPSSALEEMVYGRGGQTIDFTTLPPRWPADNKVLDYQTWLNYEKEIDKQTNDRIEIYERAIEAGLSKEEIIEQIKSYNNKLHPRYFHNSSVAERPGDIERELYKTPPKGSFTPDIMVQRQADYETMVYSMTSLVKEMEK